MESEKAAGHVKGGSATDIAYSLRGMVFPAGHTDMIEYARRHSSNEEVLLRLDKIEDRGYESIDDVLELVGKAA